MTDEKSTYGEITLRYTPQDEEGEDLEEVIVNSPNNLLDDSKRLVHILNQKSDSGRGLFQTNLNYVTALVESKNIPLNATMTVKNDDHEMVCKLEDYFTFISASGNIQLTSYGSKETEIGISWINDPIKEENESEVDPEAEVISE